MGTENDTLPQLPYSFRPSPAGIVVSIVLGLLVSIPILTILQRGPSVAASVLAVMGLVWLGIVFFILWIMTQQIVLTPEEVVCRKRFSTRSALYADISQVFLIEADATYKGQHIPTYTLGLSRHSSGDPLSIMLETIRQKVPQATFNQTADYMRQGVFNPVNPLVPRGRKAL